MTLNVRGSGSRAVLLGTGTHTVISGIPEVPAATHCLADLRQVLVDRCGFAASAVAVVSDPSTPTELGTALADQADQADPDGLLLVYYVGHGFVSPAGELYLATRATDARPTRLAYTALAYAQVRTCLLECPAAAVVVILDCCFSGRAVGTLGDPLQAATMLAQVRGGYVLTSAAGDELALAPPGQRHTAFTGQLLALLTAGDPLGPAELTLGHLYRYLARALPARGFPRPRRAASGGVENITIAANPAYRTPHAELDPEPASVADSPEPAAVCPFPGLAAFGPAEAEWFFGREELTGTLVDRLAERMYGPGLQLVAGASGSGKSSLLRAGLLSALDRGVPAIPGSSTWPRLLLTPTATPTQALAEGVSRLNGEDATTLAAGIRANPDFFVAATRALLAERSGDASVAECRLIVVVDQAEELFTLCEDGHDRQAFIRALTAASTGDAPAALVVLGLRADFYGHCAAYPELVPTLESGPVAVGAMSTAQLRRTISEPAAAVGLGLEPGLVELLLRDLGAEADADAASYDPGALPLLSHVLRETWARRERRTLTVAGYTEAGGIRGAIATTAERAYGRLDSAEQQLARLFLLRLVRIVPDSEPTRRRADRQRLIQDQPDPPAAEKVLTALADARLITVDEQTVEITHEKLLSGWDRLRTWVDTDRAGLAIHYQITEAAETWDREARDSDRLYRGAPLALASEWADDPANQAQLVGLERTFLDTSVRAAARRTRRLRQLIAGLAVLLVLALTAVSIAVWQRQNALTQSSLALARSFAVASAAASSTDPGGSMLLAAEAFRQAPTLESRSALFNTQSHLFEGQLTIDPASNEFRAPSELFGVAFSPDGLTVATADPTGGAVRLADVATHRQLFAFTGTGNTTSVAFSPDGHVLAAGGDGTIVWDVSSRRELDRFGGGVFATLAFSPDGKTLATGDSRGALLCDLNTHETAQLAEADDVYGVAFSPDGHLLATGGADGAARLWGTTTHQQVAVLSGHAKAVHSVAFSPDGHLLATGSDDGTLRLWDTATHQQMATLSVGQNNAVNSVAFSPDGLSIASGSDDDRARIWDVTSHQQLATLGANNGAVNGVAFSPDGQSLVTTSTDGTAKLVSLTGPILLRHPDSASTALAFSPRGDILATGGDHSVWLWNAAAHRQLSILPATDVVGQLAFSPDGRLLAVGSTDGTVALWEVDTGRRLADFTDATAGSFFSLGVAFSPDGQVLAFGSRSSIQLWTVTTHQKIATLSADGQLTGIAFSPDGHLVAAGGLDFAGVELWDVTTHQQLAVLAKSDGFSAYFAVAFSPDGRTLAATSQDRTVRIFDVARHQQAATVTGFSDAVHGVAFSPNGKTLAASDDNGKIRLSDTATYQTLAMLDGPTKGVYNVAFSPDGRTLATSGKAVLWDMDPDRVIERICRIVSPISPEQWTRLLPEIPYRPTCP